MIDHFDRAVAIVLAHEGALSDHPDDDGGLTRFGISQTAYPDLDIRTLSRDQAIALYRRDYWEPCGCAAMPWWAALTVFDCAVNQGPATARRLIQQAASVAVDGRIGPVTLDAIRRLDPLEGIARLQAFRTIRYARHPDWLLFGRGWMRRAFHVALRAAGPSFERP